MQIDRLSATCIWDAVSGNAGSCGSATFVFLHQVLSWRWELRLRPSDPTKHEKTTTEPQHTPATLRYACVRDDTPFAPLLTSFLPTEPPQFGLVPHQAAEERVLEIAAQLVKPTISRNVNVAGSSMRSSAWYAL